MIENDAASEFLNEKQVPHPVGPSAASESVYVEHAPILRRVAMRKYGIPAADAEGLVHDVFINLMVMPREINNLRSYLIAAICNACKNYLRSRQSEERKIAAAEREPEPDTADNELIEGLSVNIIVARTLARLGPRCREVLKRYYLSGEPTKDIAAALKTTAPNVNYLMHVCRKRARAIYEDLTRVV